MPPPRAERGTFAKISFALLLIRALDKHWTGALTIEPPSGVTHRLELDRGLVCRVLVPDGYARLGRLMVDAGVISTAELDLVLEGAPPLGSELKLQGLIDAKTLQRGLVLQLLKRLSRIFGYAPETSWYFSAELTPFEGLPTGVRIDTLRALWAGLSSHGEQEIWLDNALDRIGPSPFRLRNGVKLSRFGFTGDAAQLVELIYATPHTLTELIASRITPDDVCRHVVYLLAITRYLDFTPVGVDVDDVAASSGSIDVKSSEDPTWVGEDNAPPQRVARIKLRRVAVGRAAAPDPPGTGERTSNGRRYEGSSATGATSSTPGVESDPGAVATALAAAALRSMLDRIDHEGPLELLGFSRQDFSTGDEDLVSEMLWRRYEQLTKRWHPDANTPAGADERAGMMRVYQALTDAFEALADPDTRAHAIFELANRQRNAVDPVSSGPRPRGRRRFQSDVTKPSIRAEAVAAADPPPAAAALQAAQARDAELGGTLNSVWGGAGPPSVLRAPQAPSSGRGARRSLSPSRLHELALVAMSEHRAEEALEFCEAARHAAPDMPDYQATSVSIRAWMDDADVPALLLELDQLLQRHSAHVQARYFRGLLRQRAGDEHAAQRDFERVLAIMPEHAGARSQLAVLQDAQDSGK